MVWTRKRWFGDDVCFGLASLADEDGDLAEGVHEYVDEEGYEKEGDEESKHVNEYGCAYEAEGADACVGGDAYVAEVVFALELQLC